MQSAHSIPHIPRCSLPTSDVRPRPQPTGLVSEPTGRFQDTPSQFRMMYREIHFCALHNWFVKFYGIHRTNICTQTVDRIIKPLLCTVCCCGRKIGFLLLLYSNLFTHFPSCQPTPIFVVRIDLNRFAADMTSVPFARFPSALILRHWKQKSTFYDFGVD